MPDYKLIGHDYVGPDQVAKVTGQAKYAEDFRADGMLYCRLLLSPMPHARVRNIDARDALKMPGVRAVLTADDLPSLSAPAAPGQPAPPAPTGAAREGARGSGQGAIAVDDDGNPILAGVEMAPEPALTNEPLYEGEPILAVAAVDEATAVAAIERIKVAYEPLPFVVDPLESLRPGSANARSEGNVVLANNTIAALKWTDADFAEAKENRMPLGKIPMTEQWTIGDVQAGFKEAAVVIDESFVIATTSHLVLEPRSALAYWQNGKLYLHSSAQSVTLAVPDIARWVGIDPTQLVFINEHTGGGFGSKGRAYQYVVIPALLAKKTGQPVMMRLTRDDETAVGRTRPGMVGRAKAGFAKGGRLTALDLFLVGAAGAYGRSDHVSSARLVSLIYQPKNMRFRGIGVLTNTTPTGAQRGPGLQVATLSHGISTPVSSACCTLDIVM